MSIDLTEEQKQALQKGEVVRVPVPGMGSDLVLMRADQYEDIREILDDERQQKAFREAGLRSALRWMKENAY